MRFLIWATSILLAVVGIALMLSGSAYASAIGGVLLGIPATYYIFSINFIDGKKGEIGALFLWGKPVRNLGPGVYLAFLGVESVRKEKGTVTQAELPSDPENIYRGDGIPPVGKFDPIRVKFGPPNPLDIDLADDPYNIEGVEEIAPVVAWQISDLMKFSLIVGDNANCLKMLSDRVVQIVGGDLATMTPAKASKELDKINKKILNGVKEETKGWGITIHQAYLKPLTYSHSLNKSVEAVSLAREGAKATVLTAKGKRDAEIAEAEGAGRATEIKADARKYELVTTGLAKVGKNGKITRLVPDANTKANADAIAALANVTTLVLGRETATPVINVAPKEK
jgi:hypothetical protein